MTPVARFSQRSVRFADKEPRNNNLVKLILRFLAGCGRWAACMMQLLSKGLGRNSWPLLLLWMSACGVYGPLQKRRNLVGVALVTLPVLRGSLERRSWLASAIRSE